MFFTELRRLGRLAGRILVIVGVVLSFFAILEVVRAYLTLRQLQWGLGVGFLVLLGLIIIWGVWYLGRAFAGYPRVLKPVIRQRIRRYAKYLVRYLERFEQNEALSAEEHELARKGRRRIAEARQQIKDDKELAKVIEEVEADTVKVLLKKLDEQAEKKIRSATRDIMLAVTLSPYRSFDLLVVLYRNMVMIKNIFSVYNSRPALRESGQIVYDTLRVVAAVNFINLGGKMLENITKGLPGMIPGVNRIVDDCTQGLAAGLLTSVTGHAAQQRCRAFGPWDYEQARKDIATHLKTFTSDVGKMFFKDITPHIKVPGGAALEKGKEVWDVMARGFYETVEAIQNFVRFRSGSEKKEATPDFTD